MHAHVIVELDTDKKHILFLIFLFFLPSFCEPTFFCHVAFIKADLALCWTVKDYSIVFQIAVANCGNVCLNLLANVF